MLWIGLVVVAAVALGPSEGDEVESRLGNFIDGQDRWRRVRVTDSWLR